MSQQTVDMKTFVAEATVQAKQALGSMAKFVDLSNALLNGLAKRLQEGKAVDKEYVLSLLEKENPDLAVALEIGDTQKAEQVVKQQRAGVYLQDKDVAAEPAKQETAVAKETPVATQTSAEPIILETVAEALVVEAVAAPVPAETTAAQTVDRYKKSVETGLVAAAPLVDANRQKTLDAIAAMKANGLKGVTFKVVPQFAANRNEMLAPAKKPTLVMGLAPTRKANFGVAA